MEEIRRWSHIYENGAPRFIEHYNSTTHKATTFVPERTCRNELDEGHFGCSVCGCHVRNLPLGSTYVRDGKRWYSTEERTLNYCPHCGAKVTEEDTDDRQQD